LARFLDFRDIGSAKQKLRTLFTSKVAPGACQQIKHDAFPV
jgi:hypothetical protein